MEENCIEETRIPPLEQHSGKVEGSTENEWNGESIGAAENDQQINSEEKCSMLSVLGRRGE